MKILIIDIEINIYGKNTFLGARHKTSQSEIELGGRSAKEGYKVD